MPELCRRINRRWTGRFHGCNFSQSSLHKASIRELKRKCRGADVAEVSDPTAAKQQTDMAYTLHLLFLDHPLVQRCLATAKSSCWLGALSSCILSLRLHSYTGRAFSQVTHLDRDGSVALKGDGSKEAVAPGDASHFTFHYAHSQS